jgi:hypothetical protein
MCAIHIIMVSITPARVPKVRFREPERNLPGRSPRTATAEVRFTIQFARAYMAQHVTLHHGTEKSEIACTRQIAINGFGIADMLTVAWRPPERGENHSSDVEFLRAQRPTIRAFEVKLNNWRKGMTQAHRYRYFANVAILVLPVESCSNARMFLGTFRKIRVGLWGFDPHTGRIVTHFTPRPCSAMEPKYQQRALKLVAKTTRALPFL